MKHANKQIKRYRTACKAIIMSDAYDDYTKALAQCGLGEWDLINITETIHMLLLQPIRGKIRYILKNVARKVMN